MFKPKGAQWLGFVGLIGADGFFGEDK
jgi:hypothetical protein